MSQEKFERFLSWEQAAQDTIDFKTIYVDMADDLIAGLLLSQIVYWHLPDKRGRTKLRVCKDGYLWIAKGREDWYDEIRITARQADRAIAILRTKGLVVTGLWKFNGAPMTHIRINTDGFFSAWNKVIEERVKSNSTKGENPFIPDVNTNLDETGNSLTEITPEISTETTTDQETATPSQGDPPPATLNDWLETIKASKNQPATLRWMLRIHLYPSDVAEEDLPTYAKVGAVAKRLHAGRLAQLIWENSGKRITGCPLEYLQAVSNGQKARGKSTDDKPTGLAALRTVMAQQGIIQGAES